MPTYDYLCNKCNNKYDIFFISKEIVEKIECPKCGSKEYKKLFSAPMLNFTKSDASSSCDSCVDNTPSYGGCSSGVCGLD